jgi:hypothetical protein
MGWDTCVLSVVIACRMYDTNRCIQYNYRKTTYPTMLSVVYHRSSIVCVGVGVGVDYFMASNPSESNKPDV